MFLGGTCAFDKKFVFGLKRLFFLELGGRVLRVIWSPEVLYCGFWRGMEGEFGEFYGGCY